MDDRRLLAPDHKGFMVSYTGMLRQAAAACNSSNRSDLAFMLDELSHHMREMGERFYVGDTSAVDEFLQLYRVAEEQRAIVRAAAAIGQQMG